MRFRPKIVVEGYRLMPINSPIEKNDRLLVPSNSFPAVMHYRPIKSMAEPCRHRKSCRPWIAKECRKLGWNHCKKMKICYEEIPRKVA